MRAEADGERPTASPGCALPVPDADRSTVQKLNDPAPHPQGRAARRRRRRGAGKPWMAATAGVVLVAAGAGGALLLIGRDARRAAARPPSPAGPQGTRAEPAATLMPQAGPVVNGRRQPLAVKVPASAGGRYALVPGTTAPPKGRGSVVRYMVEVERGLPIAGAGFAAEVHRVLNDPRSWGHGGTMRFMRVSEGAARFRVSLSSPALTDRMCAPLVTHGELSCRAGRRSVINAHRYGEGATTYGDDLATYREYVINHEVGHALGHGHQQCPGPGRRAPVMVQQTKSLYGCRPNAWPFPRG